ncbi:MAG TPA: FtsW/RodA/SpoVE family cell cycle protein [Candidatus Coprenecus stercoripullorum]|nr:FtsW/RodA/SpoVE family cell cycle protein [Candidatus Coprenecus stercoripullorum]
MKNDTTGRLRRAFPFRGDRIIWLTVLFFAMISILVVYSSTTALAYRNASTPFNYMVTQFKYYIYGFCIMLICYRIPLGIYRRIAVTAFYATILLLTVPIIMHLADPGHSLRSFTVKGFDIQPSEIAKVTVVLYLGRILEKCSFTKTRDFMLKIVAPIGVLCGLSLIGSASVVVIICTVSFLILVSYGMPRKYLLMAAGLAAVAVLAVFSVNKFTGWFSRLDTVEGRVERFFTGEEKEMTEEEREEYEDKIYQEEQAKKAIQLGRIPRGPGGSIQRDILPNPYDDYAYCIIVEEYGLIGAIGVLMLYIWFFYRCIIIAGSCSRLFSTVTVLGLGLLVLFQAFLHIFVNTGLIPVTGQNLPMISKGGSSLIFMSCAFGIILSVNRTSEVIKDKRQKEPEKEGNND